MRLSEICSKISFLILALSLTEISVADDTARSWIEKMSVAMQDLSYSGTFVYLHDGDIESMKIVHSKTDGVEHERLLSLNGEAREIIRNASDVVCIWPGSKSVIVSKVKPRTPFPTFEAQQTGSLEENYSFRELGRARIVDRQARMIDISPLDEYRYGYRLWIDIETSLLLRSAMSNQEGLVVEQVMFTSIEFEQPRPIEFFNASIKGSRYEWASDAYQQNGPQPEINVDIPTVEKMSLPNGFELQSDSISSVAGSTEPARRLLYSDGLASLSVFIAESGSEESDLLGISTMGAVSAYGIKLGKWHATIVGEVPIHTVEMVGKSVQIER